MIQEYHNDTEEKKLYGSLIYLRPLQISDKEKFYRWATCSDATPFWYGELYRNTIPDPGTFFVDWDDAYFTGPIMQHKRGFVICISETDTEIGEINYQSEEIDGTQYFDLDIIIASDMHKGKGFGTEALIILTGYLRSCFPAIVFSLYALCENLRAIQSYRKAGFSSKETFKDDNGLNWMLLVK
ncbi:GNAT family N-acetyltransferase [Lacibacter sp. MH-610]|uniref:GNAT family N-acetyltransferase n=1 Tax=Lacibacter sp. MH-610 TaxID=3020883 RepID=UPI003891C23B